MASNSLALPRSRRIRPPCRDWWHAVLMVAIAFGSIAATVIDGEIGIDAGVSFGVQCFVVFVYWPQLRHPHKPYRSPLDPIHLVVIVALLASIGTALLVP